MKLPIPKGLQERLKPAVERGERFLRGWEWTWTKAVVIGVVLSWFALVTLTFVPSWFLYFADNRLEWSRTRLLVTIRDMVVLGETTTVFLAMVVIGYFLQKARARLRGEGGASRPSGGYR